MWNPLYFFWYICVSSSLYASQKRELLGLAFGVANVPCLGSATQFAIHKWIHELGRTGYICPVQKTGTGAFFMYSLEEPFNFLPILLCTQHITCLNYIMFHPLRLYGIIIPSSRL